MKVRMQSFTVDGKHVVFSFSRDGMEVEKLVKWPFVDSASFGLEIQRRAREADRDIAANMFGEEWRQHCEFQSNFYHLMSPGELSRLEIE